MQKGMRIVQIKGRIFGREEKVLTIENGIISAIGTHLEPDCLDFGDAFVLPGFIDIHTHGAMCADTMDATDKAMQTMKVYMANHGVTSFLPTTVSMPVDASCTSICAAKRNEKGEGATILGVHLEGPYFSEEYKGAQNPAYLRNADIAEIEKMVNVSPGFVRIMSLAPEVPGAIDAILHLESRGVVAAIGHTAADYETAKKAIDAGVRNATHLYNGMAPLLHRAPGTIGAILENPDVYAELICDGIHVHPAAAKMAMKAKGYDKVILISDSMRAAGMPDGSYTLGGQHVTVLNGVARTDDGALAGSTSNVLDCFRNVVKWGIPFDDAVKMATENPATLIGVEKKGKIEVGFDADFTILSPDLDLVATVIGGKVWRTK